MWIKINIENIGTHDKNYDFYVGCCMLYTFLQRMSRNNSENLLEKYTTDENVRENRFNFVWFTGLVLVVGQFSVPNE